eukprot:364912-Chlamydomonas_euryale.AAC.5
MRPAHVSRNHKALPWKVAAYCTLKRMDVHDRWHVKIHFLSMHFRLLSQSQNYKEWASKSYASAERSLTEGIKKRAGRRHNRNAMATAHGLESPDNKPTPPTGTVY